MSEKKVKVFDLRSGKTVICIVDNSTPTSKEVLNPMIIYPADEGRLGFSPMVYTDPKKMKVRIYQEAIDFEYVPDKGIIDAYLSYVERLTSSIIQLDKSVKTVQLNG